MKIERLKMKLKELNNLFFAINYFNAINNKDDYFKEFMLLYGDRDLTKKVVEIYNSQGEWGIGQLFNLKTKKWIEISNIYDEISELEKTNTTILTTNNKVNKGDRTRQTNTNNSNEVIPFDVVETVENEKELNTVAETENNTDNSTMENKTVYSGFSKEKINYFIRKFENYSEYRYAIYNDIVNMITLQIYD